MFCVKICGITNVEDARAVVTAGADAVGLNFYPKSPRYVTPEQASPIIDALPAEVVKVALFVNAGSDDVCRTFDDLKLDLIQLHGDEPPEFIARLGGRPVMRAFRIDQRSRQPLPQQTGTHGRYCPVENAVEGRGSVLVGTIADNIEVPNGVFIQQHVPGALNGTG